MTVCVYSFYHIIGEEDPPRVSFYRPRTIRSHKRHITLLSISSQMLAIVGRPAATEQPRSA